MLRGIHRYPTLSVKSTNILISCSFYQNLAGTVKQNYTSYSYSICSDCRSGQSSHYFRAHSQVGLSKNGAPQKPMVEKSFPHKKCDIQIHACMHAYIQTDRHTYTHTYISSYVYITIYIYVCVLYLVYYICLVFIYRTDTYYTSSTAQGGGGSFKNRKLIGEVGCCESRMAERSHWWTDRWLRSPLFLYLFLWLSTYLSI